MSSLKSVNQREHVSDCRDVFSRSDSQRPVDQVDQFGVVLNSRTVFDHLQQNGRLVERQPGDDGFSEPIWFNRYLCLSGRVGDDLPSRQPFFRVCRQGLPTSPVAANIAAVAFDARLLKSLKGFTEMFGFLSFAYTRYADDLIISFSFTDGLQHPEVTYSDILVRLISNRVAECGWKVAEHKTHIQHAKAGRRIIVGIAVDDRVQATRKTRRKLRAAKHHCTKPGQQLQAVQSHRGIAEWAACKLPRRVRSTRQMMGVLAGSGPVAAVTNNAVTVAVAGSGRRVLIEKIADDSANQ